MELYGTPEHIIKEIAGTLDVKPVLKRVSKRVPFIKRQIAEYQGAALYALATRYFGANAHILEIGTAHGYSAAILAEACPDASIITLNPNAEEAALARENLKDYPNVEVVEAISWDYLKSYRGPKLDLVFVDGDHKRVRMDLPWWDWLKEGGLLLFHDYSPAGTYRECPPVFEAVNEFSRLLGREPDVKVVEDEGVGMAGFYNEGKSTRQIKGETIFELSRCHTASVLSYSTIEALYHLAGEVKALDGDIVEAGVTNGGSAMAIWLGARKNKKHKRGMWLYDTFDGMPKPGSEDGAKALAKWEARKGTWCKGDAEKVLDLAKELKIPTEVVGLIEGDFERLTPNAEYDPIAFLHIDATLYRSTKAALQAFYPHVIPGGIVCVSAYGHWGGVKFAVDKFWETLPYTVHYLTIDGVNVWWKKPNDNG